MPKINNKTALTVFVLTVCLFWASAGRGERIKDIVDIQGIRSNPLTGIGLVVGLADTGDKALPSQQMLVNILRESGVVVTAGDIAGGSIALVAVTTQLGPFDREGARLDVSVSALSDAESLQGGRLLPTPLRGLDGQIYVVAQGSVSLGGWGASGKTASIKKNHLTVGTIPNGATVEREEIAHFVERMAGERFITLNLRNNDFSTAERISTAINEIYQQSTVAIDAGTIKVRVPNDITQRHISKFIVDITRLNVQVDVPAVVVINERTGTIVVGENVGISPAQAICQGSLVVKVKETQNVFQPTAMFSDAGSTEVVDETLLEVKESTGHLVPIPRIVTVSELAKALNAIGVTPTDLVAIFNALKKAGALQARLEIM